jgi:hypothetical protein
VTYHARIGFRRCGTSLPQLSSGPLASAKYIMRTIIFQILCALTFQHLSAQMPSSDFLLDEEWSPQRNILVQHYYIDSLDRPEIWLIDKHDSSNVFLLDSLSWRGTSVIFSPDQAWLVENVEIVSNFREIHLFKRIQGLHYSEVNDAHIYEKVFKLFAKTEHFHHLGEFGHARVAAATWLPDSKAFLLIFDGWDNDQGVTVGGWTCLFDVNSLTATLDFNKYLRGGVKRHQ